MKPKILKTPIGYYGGKQTIVKRIVEVLESIPHKIYCEPFAGGSAVLFAKPLRNNGTQDYREAINDINKNLVTFYKVAREQPDLLLHWIEFTPYSYVDHRRAYSIYKNPSGHSEIEIAWSFYVCCNTSFAKKIGGGWSKAKTSQNLAATFDNRRKRLPQCFERLNRVFVECMDAIEFIRWWDSPDTLFYCDPPYPDTDQGHYRGYSMEDWQKLCDTLDGIQGSYVLSGFPIDYKPKSYQQELVFTRKILANTKGGKRRNQQEILWVRNNRQS